MQPCDLNAWQSSEPREHHLLESSRPDVLEMMLNGAWEGFIGPVISRLSDGSQTVHCAQHGIHGCKLPCNMLCHCCSIHVHPSACDLESPQKAQQPDAHHKSQHFCHHTSACAHVNDISRNASSRQQSRSRPLSMVNRGLCLPSQDGPFVEDRQLELAKVKMLKNMQKSECK